MSFDLIVVIKHILEVIILVDDLKKSTTCQSDTVTNSERLAT